MLISIDPVIKDEISNNKCKSIKKYRNKIIKILAISQNLLKLRSRNFSKSKNFIKI